ncbi:hypothetical protein EPYR_02324 [Erwinia pyrifoliae DSM 12163]|nr:hypothetical protein EPYR_02324 [Erwinia pyrifoliae DSM 12163]
MLLLVVLSAADEALNPLIAVLIKFDMSGPC